MEIFAVTADLEGTPAKHKLVKISPTDTNSCVAI